MCTFYKYINLIYLFSRDILYKRSFIFFYLLSLTLKIKIKNYIRYIKRFFCLSTQCILYFIIIRAVKMSFIGKYIVVDLYNINMNFIISRI